MEDLLVELEQEIPLSNPPIRVSQEYKTALEDFRRALRDALPSLLEVQSGASDQEISSEEKISAEWLVEKCKIVSSDLMSPQQLARAIWEASQLQDESRQQEALFAALGASEAAMELLMELGPLLPQIQKISESDFNVSTSQPHAASSSQDSQATHHQRLREEVMEAEHLAAVAQAQLEEEEAEGYQMAGRTHTVTRKSHVAAQKAAQKAQQRAAKARKRAIAAGAILPESTLMSLDNVAEMGSGGLLHQTTDELRTLQDSLLPEGTRQGYNQEGLPAGTERDVNDLIGYEQVVIPPPKKDPAKLHPRLAITDIMDSECAKAFAGTTSLNPMQSAVYDVAFLRRENMLVCAPTGAGKTNVAMLTCTAHFRDVGLIGRGRSSAIETGKKVVYIAPMKALAQEVVEKFSSKLKGLGLIVRELTGDMQLTRAEAESANVIVTTPEKWDVVTRKSGNDDNSLGNKCGLLIIDEVHLLADDRGAVIESVVARLHRLVESRQRQMRIVGLSATLPNYQDVAEFLQVPSQGLFYFGPEHRPVPLRQTFVGVMGKVKDRFQMEKKMNQVCYETVKQALERGHQAMVFVHSRKGTSDTAKALTDLASKDAELDRLFVTQGKDGPHGDAHSKYSDRVMKSRNREVSQHFYNGFGIHHAGMLRSDRKLSEQMFADGAIKVLCCTATLAWGVNLPARCVVIKGTDLYNPEKGKMTDLGILDVQQIFGRAGRPQFDTYGEATLITNHEALPRYLDKLVRAVPIESKFIKQLKDHLNAEIVGGTVASVAEAVSWLLYTYLYVRMVRNPLAYGITQDQKNDDPLLRGRCEELVMQAAGELAESEMIIFDRDSGRLGMTDLGRVAAHFYVQAESVLTFKEMMMQWKSVPPSELDLFHLIASASEFEQMRIRPEEQSELDKLQKKGPLQDEGPIHDSATKALVLMQTFVSRERLTSFTLISDTNYIAANAGRVARAIFEMFLKSGKASIALKLLRIAKSIDNQFWWFQTPIRHFEEDVGFQVIRAIETRQLHSRSNPIDDTHAMLDMTPGEVAQICRAKPEVGKKVQRLIRNLPLPTLECQALPVTQNVLRFHVIARPAFEWNGRYHKGALMYWLWVEDTNSDRIYHSERIIFARKTHPEPVSLDIPVPLFERSPNHYVVRCVSESWVGVETACEVYLDRLLLPKQEKFFTEIEGKTPLRTTELQNQHYERIYDSIETFNPIQTQLFHFVYHTDRPILLGAPAGCGKTLVAELALLRLKKKFRDGICVFICPVEALAQKRHRELTQRFGGPPLKWNVMNLSRYTGCDHAVLQQADVLVCTPSKWDMFMRSWSQGRCGSADTESKAFFMRVRLLVVDQIHLLGDERGAVLESIISRTRSLSRHLIEEAAQPEGNEKGKIDFVRIIGLSTTLANPFDVADWIGIDTSSKEGLYNFPPVRPQKPHIQGYHGKHYFPRMALMNKPTYAAIKEYAADLSSMVFVASRRQTRLTALAIISLAAADLNPKAFLGCSDDYIEVQIDLVKDEVLKHTLQFGIGLHHAGLSNRDKDTVEKLYLNGQIRVMVATATYAWGTNLPASLVIVKGTEYFDGKASRYVDYPLTDVLQMIGRAGRPGYDTKGEAVVLVEMSKKVLFTAFLNAPFPVESCLMSRVRESLNVEIATGAVSSVAEAAGYLAWTFLARRVKANPSYYGADSDSTEDVEKFLLATAKMTIEQLVDQGCVTVDDVHSSVVPTFLGKACSTYYLRHNTPKQMEFGVRKAAELLGRESEALPAPGRLASTKFDVSLFDNGERVDELSLAWLLYAMASTHEFDDLPVRHNEDVLNEELSENLEWGPDAAIVLSGSKERTYVHPEIYASPHTKCFLLLQAHLQRARLPISDYKSDLKLVVEQAGRLLSAMNDIALGAAGELNGSFDLLSQFPKVQQYLFTQSLPSSDPLQQVPELKPNRIREMRKKDKSISFYSLRSKPFDHAVSSIRSVLAGPAASKAHAIAKTVFSFPAVSLKDIEIAVVSSEERKRKLVVSLQIESSRNEDANSSLCLTLLLGSIKARNLLSYSSVETRETGSFSVTSELEFDIQEAREDGKSNVAILRVLLDRVRGLDLQALVRLD